MAGARQHDPLSQSQLEIDGVKWKVTYFKDADYIDPPTWDDIGTSLMKTLEIRLWDSPRPEFTFQILVHEIFESMLDHLGIKMKHCELDRFAVEWAKFLIKNGWVKVEERKSE